MSYTVSLSKLFKDQLAQIVEFDSIINSKKVGRNPEETAKELEMMQKRGMSIQTTKISSKVDDTKYSVIYKVVNNPRDKLIAKRIIRSK